MSLSHHSDPVNTLMFGAMAYKALYQGYDQQYKKACADKGLTPVSRKDFLDLAGVALKKVFYGKSEMSIVNIEGVRLRMQEIKDDEGVSEGVSMDISIA